VERNDGSGVDLDSFVGLGRQQPLLALLMALFMLSLTGIPLTAGFVGKWYVFLAAVDAGLVWLAVIGVVTSVFGAYYYLRVVVAMFLQEGPADISMPRLPRSLAVALIVTTLGTLILGIFPNLLAGLSGGVSLALALGG